MIQSVSHSVATTVAHAPPRDWLPVVVQLIASIPATVIAGLALFYSNRQNKRMTALTERQTINEEKKVKADRYGEKYDAWKSLSDASDVLFRAILSLNASASEIEPQLWVTYASAQQRLGFLFSDAVIAAAKDLRESLQNMILAKLDIAHPKPHDPSQVNSLEGLKQAFVRCEAAKETFTEAARIETVI